MDEEHRQNNDSSIILRTTVPFVEIDSLFIDLSSCIDKPDAGNCDHFSIRGYASQMREKDWKKCWPFDLDSNYESEETISLLPPFHVPHFRWWQCQNCRKETAPAGLQSSNIDMPDKRKAVVNTYTNFCNLNHPPSFSTEKEKKVEGDEVDSRWILNLEIPIVTPEVESSLMLEQNKSDPETCNSEHRESAENCKLLCGNEVAEVELGLQNLKVIDENPKVDDDDEKQTSARNEQIEIALSLSEGKMITMACNGKSYPAELDESIAVTSEHIEISVENYTQDHHTDKPGSLHRRKTRKVRLLTELLNENGNIKTNHIGTEESPSHGSSEKSEGLKELSALQCPVAAKRNIRCSGQNLKSKLPQDDDCFAAETSSYHGDHKIQALKGDVETADLFHANESENAMNGTGLRTKKCLLNKNRNDVNSINSKKTNKKIRLDACSSHNNPLGNGDNMSEISLKHNGFCGNAMDPFLLFGSRIEPTSSLSKRKSKMPIVDGRQDFTWRNSMPRRDLVSKDLRDNEPVVSCPSVPDESSKSLHLSLTSHSVTQRNEKKSIFETQDGSPSLLSWQGGTPTTSVIRNKDSKSKKQKDSNVLFNYSDTFAKQGEHSVTQRNEKKSIFETQDGSPSLLSWQGGTPTTSVIRNKDSKSKKQKDSNVLFNYSDTFAKQGEHCGVDSKKTTGRTCFSNGKQISNSQVDDDSWSQLQAMDNSIVNKLEKSITVQENLAAQMKQSEHMVGKISEQRAIDDIPMEIVELMAKNQYERCLDNNVNSESLSKTSSKQPQVTNFSNACGKSGLQEKISHKWKPQIRNGRNNLYTAEDNVAYIKQSSGNYFSHPERRQFNIDHQRQTVIPPEYTPFRHSQNKSSNTVKFLASSNCENSYPQYSQYGGGLADYESSRVQSFSGYTTHQPVHLWTEALSNHDQYVPTTHKRIASQSTSVNASKNYPESSSKRAMIREHSLKFFNPKVMNFEKDDGNYGLENYRTNAKHPFSCHSNGIEPPRNLMGSLDLYSNETVSAMHLLSLMDAGMQRGETHDNPRFPKIPISQDLKAKGISRMDIGLHKAIDTINYSSKYCGEIHPSKKSHVCFPPASVGDALISPSVGNESCEIVSDLTGKVALQCKQKEITKCSTSTWNRVPKSQNSVFTSGSLGSNEGVFPIHLQKKCGGPSSSLVSMSGYNRGENSGQCIIERRGTKQMLEHSKVSSELGICSINKNPAEFSVPEAGNVYMIGAEDLQFSKMISPQKIFGLNDMDGRKRKRNKHTVVKQHALRYIM